MSTSVIVPQQARYWVTTEGHAAALAEESCECHLGPVGGMLICCRCLTGWQLTRPQAARNPGKSA